MARTYGKYDEDFKQGAVRLVVETGQPIAKVARDLGVHEGTLGNWVAKYRAEHDGSGKALTENERAELVALRKENSELRTQRVLKRSVALWDLGPGLASLQRKPHPKHIECLGRRWPRSP